MSFLFYLFLFFLIVAILFPMIGSKILQSIFKGTFGYQGDNDSAKNKKKGNTTYQKTSRKKKKIIGKDEGEYIDFEEVKEDK